MWMSKALLFCCHPHQQKVTCLLLSWVNFRYQITMSCRETMNMSTLLQDILPLFPSLPSPPAPPPSLPLSLRLYSLYLSVLFLFHIIELNLTARKEIRKMNMKSTRDGNTEQALNDVGITVALDFPSDPSEHQMVVQRHIERTSGGERPSLL